MNLDEHHHVFILTSATDVVFSIFHVPCTILFTVQFHTVSSVSSVFRTSIYAVFVIDCFRKQTLLIKWYNFVFTKDLPDQSNVQAATAEKEEYYTLCNMMSIKLQNYCFFSLRYILKIPKCLQSNWTIFVMYVFFFFFFFFKFYQRYASLQVLFKIFAQICYLVICKEIFAILRTSVSRKTF